MHEGHVDEAAARRRKLAIEASRDGVPRGAPRRRIARVGARRIAEEIARELIEQENEGEIGVALAQPAIVGAGRRALMIGAEAAAGAVEFGLALEPHLALAAVLRRPRRAEPEIEQRGDPGGIGRGERRLRA